MSLFLPDFNLSLKSSSVTFGLYSISSSSFPPVSLSWIGFIIFPNSPMNFLLLFIISIPVVTSCSSHISRVSESLLSAYICLRRLFLCNNILLYFERLYKYIFSIWESSISMNLLLSAGPSFIILRSSGEKNISWTMPNTSVER